MSARSVGSPRGLDKTPHPCRPVNERVITDPQLYAATVIHLTLSASECVKDGKSGWLGHLSRCRQCTADCGPQPLTPHALIVVAGLEDDQLRFAISGSVYEVDEAMLRIDPPRPCTSEFMFERFGFPDALVRVAAGVVNQPA